MTRSGNFVWSTVLTGALLTSACVQGGAGSTGTVGPQGPTGLEGPEGPPGATGDPGGNGTMGAAGNPGNGGTAGKLPLPNNIQLDHVNLSSFIPTIPGLHLISRGAGANNIAGAFDYDGTNCASGMTDKGNMLWVGFTKPGGSATTMVSDIASFVVNGRMERGTSPKLSMYLIVDCDGNSTFDPATQDTVIAVDPSKLALTGTMATYTIANNSASFYSLLGTAGTTRCGIKYVADGADMLTHVTAGAKLIAAQPKSCGMPNGAVMAPLLLVQGDKDDTTFRDALIQDVTVNTAAADTYAFNR